jgi:hypothetical protein
MEEITLQELVKASYSGSISAMSTYISLAVQALAVIIGGIILWRASNVLHKRKREERSRNAYFETPYSKGWKRK